MIINEERALETAGVPANLRKHTLGDFPVGIAKLVEQRPHSFLISGSAGVGKSALAAAILRYWLPSTCEVDDKSSVTHVSWGVCARWVSVAEWMWEWSNWYARGAPPDEQPRTWESISNYRVIVLDDVGADRGNALSEQMLYLVLSTREARGLATIATTNSSRASLIEFSSRVASRLESFMPLKLAGNDRRRWREEPHARPV